MWGAPEASSLNEAGSHPTCSKCDMNVVNGRIAADGDAIRKQSAIRFQAMIKRGQDFQDRQAQQFASFERQIGAQEQARHDAASDFIEYIGGLRNVYDTRTGQMQQVDLFHSDATVSAMNDAVNDPGACVGIPLRSWHRDCYSGLERRRYFKPATPLQRRFRDWRSAAT